MKIHTALTSLLAYFYPRRTKETPVHKNQTLLLRPRRASLKSRRTQIQIPLALFDSPFFSGISHITNTYGEQRKLIVAHARGRVNTIKVEVPEIWFMTEPVLRLTRTKNGIIYEAFSSYSTLGTRFLSTLSNGIPTGKTRTTSPFSPSLAWPAKSTWYQLVA